MNTDYVMIAGPQPRQVADLRRDTRANPGIEALNLYQRERELVPGVVIKREIDNLGTALAEQADDAIPTTDQRSWFGERTDRFR
jgi:hypothetical protein